ncbi:MAG: UDP-glucose 4-epimerase, partial [Methylobacter sp.]
MLNVLITGANGFVGKAVCSHLAANGFAVKAVVRKLSDNLPQDFPRIAIGEIDGQTDWQSALQKVDAVVHLAARVHVMDDKAADPLAEYRKTNVDGTLNLARQALEFGIKRFIYIST